MVFIMNVTKKTLISSAVFAASALMSLGAQADGTYVTDQGHTEIVFGWSHAGVSLQHGEFTKAVGTLELAEKMEDSKISVTIEADSLSSGFEPLDKHLKSADFFEVETYPEITFVSTSVDEKEENMLEVTGDLTIHGVTKPVTLQAELTHKGEHPLGKNLDYYKGEWVAFSATTEIDHQAFGVGGFSTGPITIEINTEMKAN